MLCNTNIKQGVASSEITSTILQKYRDLGIEIVDVADPDGFVPRDVFYQMIEDLNQRDKPLGITGLWRTGKTVLLNQLHQNAHLFGVKPDEVLHVVLHMQMGDQLLSRDEVDIHRLDHMDQLVYPDLGNVMDLYNDLRVFQNMHIRCILIDEITLCEDLILASKGYFDKWIAEGVKIVITGTESLSLQFASLQSLYTRVKILDISYISFGEYCRVKQLPLSTYAEKREALDRYISHGNLLDDSAVIDAAYLEHAVGDNMALSIIRSDDTAFFTFEHHIRELSESILQYLSLIEKRIQAARVQDWIQHRHTSRTVSETHTDREEIDTLGGISAEYVMSFDRSVLGVTWEQLTRIDQCFTDMGLLYSLTQIPYRQYSNGAIDSEDICLMHSLTFQMGLQMAATLREMHLGLSEEEVSEIADSVQSTLYGRVLEDIVALQIIRDREQQEDLLHQLSYYAPDFSAKRRCTKFFLYTFRDTIQDQEQEQSRDAEIDLVRSLPETIDLIEIQNSTVIDEGQTRWLRYGYVEEEIRDHISDTRPIRRFVFYLGTPCEQNGIHYVNIPDFLLSCYSPAEG